MGTPRNLYRQGKPVEPLSGREHSGIKEQEAAEFGSRRLRNATQRLFRKWERIHGFQEGAGEILLPAGYSADVENLKTGTFARVSEAA